MIHPSISTVANCCSWFNADLPGWMLAVAGTRVKHALGSVCSEFRVEHSERQDNVVTPCPIVSSNISADLYCYWASSKSGI